MSLNVHSYNYLKIKIIIFIEILHKIKIITTIQLRKTIKIFKTILV